MKPKHFLILFFVLLTESLYSQFVFQDTLFIKRTKNDEFYHRIFFETNKKSIFYDYVAKFDLAIFDTDSYARSLKYLKSHRLPLTRNTYNDLPKEWVIVQVYQGKMCLYSPCDYYSHYKIKLTDSAIIDWDGEGPQAMRVSSFNKIDSLHYKITIQSQSFKNKDIEITFIDKFKGIAVFHDIISPKYVYQSKEQYFLMVDAKKMRGLPFIVNVCDYSKMFELDFDEIDYKKLISGKK